MNEREKNASIDYILSRGLAKPQTAGERIAEMTRALGLRFIFWDMGYSMFFAAVTLVIVFTVFRFVPNEYRCSAAVGAAPLTLLLITLFAETSERASSLYELKQLCRCTVRQVAALRVICYSLAGAAFTALIAAVRAQSAYEYLSLFPLCLSALFLCAVLGLYVLRRLRGRWAYAAYSAVWAIVNLSLPLSLGDAWEDALRAVPIAISVALAAIGAAVLAYQIAKMLSEVKAYAVAQ
jgi:hypothetical protein